VAGKTLIVMKEFDDFFAKFLWGFQIGEVSGFSQHDQAGLGDCLSDVDGTFHRDEIRIPVDDQGRDAEPLELGKQVVFGRQPRFVH